MSRLVPLAALTLLLLAAAGPVAAADDAPGATVGATEADWSDPAVTDTAGPAPAATTPPSLADTESRAGPGPPAIVAVYPDPVRDGDRGEFVLLSLPEGANRSAWTLDDGGATVPVGIGTGGGRIAVAADPGLARNHTDATVLEIPGRLALSNGGETLVLRRNGTAVDRLRYDDAVEGELYADGRWRPLGATNHSVTRRSVDTVRPFLLPDSPEVPADLVADAEERLLLAGYTFESERTTRRLIAAAERGVRVSVLLEASPVGGRSARAARLLDRLSEAGVSVRVLGGPRSRYAYHHAKYAVVDDSALVLTENWKPSGVGGRANRGWGVVVPDGAVAADLAAVFERDAGNVDAIPWREYRAGRRFTPADDAPANGTFPATTPPDSLDAEAVELLVAPDNAEGRVTELLANADREILVEQVSIGGPDGPFVGAAVDAARRGVEVRILLSGAWYVREENRRLVEHLRRLADREDLPLSAKLADPGDRYRKIHAKGVVVDGEAAAVGSLNWNAHAARENREVVVVVHGDAAGYYADAFERDWTASESADEGLPYRLLALTAVVGLSAAVLVARRVAFEDEAASGSEETGAVWREG